MRTPINRSLAYFVGGRGDSVGTAFWHDLLLWQMSHVLFHLVLCLCLIWYPLCLPPHHKLIPTLRCDVFYHFLLSSLPQATHRFSRHPTRSHGPVSSTSWRALHSASALADAAVSGCSWSRSRCGMKVQQHAMWPQRPEQEVRIITERVNNAKTHAADFRVDPE